MKYSLISSLHPSNGQTIFLTYASVLETLQIRSYWDLYSSRIKWENTFFSLMSPRRYLSMQSLQNLCSHSKGIIRRLWRVWKQIVQSKEFVDFRRGSIEKSFLVCIMFWLASCSGKTWFWTSIWTGSNWLWVDPAVVVLFCCMGCWSSLISMAISLCFMS